MHLFFAGVGLVGAWQLLRLTRSGTLGKREATFIGLIAGAVCGSGIALGIRFQSTEANIHSGFSFAAAVEWLFLAFVGGVLGLVFGILIARRAVNWRPAATIFLVFALLAATGWVVAAARPTIDCDENFEFCDARYSY